MKTLVHISDLHFGASEEAVVASLVEVINTLKPDIVAVSGDLTQRARSREFKEARAFLDALPQPQIVVPGNHDIPLYNLFSRFARPLDKYRNYITEDLTPMYLDEEMIVVGINTARSLTIKGGRINVEQIAWVRETLCALGKTIIKIVVTHHPFDLPAGYSDRDLVGRAQLAIEALADCGIDLFLAGHLHISHTGQTATRYQIGSRSALVVQAGTATSTRSRGEANSFNVIRIAYPSLFIERHVWDSRQGSFLRTGQEQFYWEGERWLPT